MGRFAIANGILDTDLDCNHHKLLNLDQLDSVVSGTVYVDPNVEEDDGAIGTTKAFKTLESALAVTPAGYNIIMRPAVYEFDGFLEVPNQVNIIAYGATISPATPGESAGLLVTSDGTAIYGLTFLGGIAPGDAVDTPDGTIAVFGGSRVLLRDVWISDQNGVGIELRDRYDGVRIEACTILRCFKGVTGAIGSSSISEISIRDCVIESNRQEGILLTGIDNAGDVALRDIQIRGNHIFSNNTAAANKAGISIDAGAIDLLITDNYISTHYDSIQVAKILRGVISNNDLGGATHNHVTVSGNKQLSITGNIISGANPSTGAPLTILGISISGDYAASDDSGPTIISGNQIVSIHTSGYSISTADTNNTLIEGNSFQRILCASFIDLVVTGNDFKVDTNTPAISLDAATRGSSGATISANRFYVTGAPTRLIATADAGSHGIARIHMLANSSSSGVSYSNGIFGNSSGAAATSVFFKGNSPVSSNASNTLGWVNDDEIVYPDQIFVSQARGVNATAVRESKAHPYLTIAIALTAATSGDTIIVEDGVFDELISAKAGVTIRFMPQAFLTCVNSNGCFQSSADFEHFSLYHEHAAITSAKAGKTAIQISHAGIYNFFLGGIYNSGTNTGTICNAVGSSVAANGCNVLIELTRKNLTDGIFSDNAHAFSLGQGSFYVRANGCTIASTVTSAIVFSSSAFLTVEDARIYSGGDEPVVINTSVDHHTYKRCTIESFAANLAAVQITGTDTNHPIFRDCNFIADAGASQSINVTGAHIITIMGFNIANKGADPPTNVTFQGGGEYVVDADVVTDFV